MGELRPRAEGGRRNRVRSAFLAIGVLALATGWIFFAPSQVGGSVDYVVVHGNSMEPLLRQGDLVVVRPADGYEVGDVVAYRSPQIGQIVLHRIKEVEAGHYVLKGDNNDFIDPEEPARADLVGEMQFHIAGAGRILQLLATPVGAVAVAVLIAFVVAWSSRGQREDDRVVETVETGAGQGMFRRFVGPSRRAIAIAGAAAVVFVALALSAYSRPPTRLVEKQVGYQHSGRFSYSAPVRKGAAAAEASVGNGEPIFTRLSDRVDVRFKYRFEAGGRERVAGKARLLARLSNITGWNRTLSTSRVKNVSGSQATLDQTISFDRLLGFIRQVEKETGTAVTDYQLEFQAEVGVVGRVAGQEVTDEFSPKLALHFDGNQLVLDGGLDAASEQLRRIEDSSVTVTETQPNRMSLLWLELDVGAARWIAVAGGFFSLAMLLLLGWIYLQALRGPESHRFEALYGDYIVPIKPGQIGSSIEVDSMEALVRLAMSYEAMILHEQDRDSDSYYVLSGNSAYCYRAGAGEHLEEVAELIPLLRSVTFVEELEDKQS